MGSDLKLKPQLSQAVGQGDAGATPAGPPESLKLFWAAKIHRVLEFFASQGITTAGNLFYGFLCVRLLPVSGYAQYTVIFGFLGTLSVLMDIGISNTLVPLVGQRIGDNQLIADYVASLRQLAHWIYFVVAPFTIVLFPLLVHHQHWSTRVVAAMVAILLVAGWVARVSATYGTVLILRRDRKHWYREQMRSSLGTLAVLLVFWAMHWLNIFSAVLINVAGMIYVSQGYFFRARRLLKVHGRPSREKRREIVHLAMPNAVSSVFYALEGQISMLLITLFGLTTAVASLGALSRLGQLFALPLQMNPLLVEPYFARLPRARLKANYLLALTITAGVGICFAPLARFFPGLFLWILGPKYAHLRYEVLLTIVAGSIRYFSGVLWTMNSARKFVYWGSNFASITVPLLLQAFFLWKVDLSTVSGVLWLSISTAIGGVCIHIGSALYGFLRGPRELRAQASPSLSEEAAHVG